MSAADKAKRTLLAIVIPRDELAFRIMQKAIGLKPPPGTTPAQAFANVPREVAYMVPLFYAQADAAVTYFHECVNAAKQPS